MSLVFFLGGHDLEMVTIRDLLAQHGAAFHDHHLAWGAKASAYRREVEEALARGEVPVLVELEHDLGLPAQPFDPATSTVGTPNSASLLVHHHGPHAGANRPTSLHQVFALLGLPSERWTRHFDLVAANDRGHIRAMLQLRPPATREEMLAIRAADRVAQGVTPADEAAARAAIAIRESCAGGRLTLLRLDSRKTSPAADLMEPALGGPGFENLLVLSPGEINFFGNGGVVLELSEAYPGGWFGGGLPDRGFWGSTKADAESVCTWLSARLEPAAARD